MISEESLLQQRCYDWFNRTYPEYKGLFFSIPNGANVSDRNRQRLTAEGMTSGVADTLLTLPSKDGKYHAFGIEFKKKTYDTKITKTGDIKLKVGHTGQSKYQKEWQKRFEEAGNKYLVIWDEETFKEEISNYLGIDRRIKDFMI